MKLVPVSFRMKRALWIRAQAVSGLGVSEVICRSLRGKLKVVQAQAKPGTTPGKSQPVRVYLPSYLEQATKGGRWMIAEAVRLHMAGYEPDYETPAEAIAAEKVLAKQQLALVKRMADADAECDRMIAEQREKALRDVEAICGERWDCSMDQMEAVMNVILRLQMGNEQEEKGVG